MAAVALTNTILFNNFHHSLFIFKFIDLFKSIATPLQKKIKEKNVYFPVFVFPIELSVKLFIIIANNAKVIGYTLLFIKAVAPIP